MCYGQYYGAEAALCEAIKYTIQPPQDYRKLWNNLHTKGFEINPYDPCVANKIIEGSQMTVMWNVNDLKISHKPLDVITGIIKWICVICGELRISQGPIYECLGMDLNYS